jgi:hypothetical protein
VIVKPRKETDDADETSEEAGEYASPPCLMHEADLAYFGLDLAPEAKKGAAAEGAQQPPGAAKQDRQDQPPPPAAPSKTKSG